MDYQKTTLAAHAAAHYRLCEKDRALPSRARDASSRHCEVSLFHSKGAFKTPTNSATGAARLSLEKSPAPGNLENLGPNCLFCFLYNISSHVAISHTNKIVNIMLTQVQILNFLITFHF